MLTRTAHIAAIAAIDTIDRTATIARTDRIAWAFILIEQPTRHSNKHHYPNQSRRTPIRLNKGGGETGKQSNRVQRQERPVGCKDSENSTSHYGSEEGRQKFLRGGKGRRRDGFHATIRPFANTLKGPGGQRHPPDVQLQPDLAVNRPPHKPAQNSSKRDKHVSTIMSKRANIYIPVGGRVYSLSASVLKR